MKLLRLDLNAFGKFSQHHIDLSDPHKRVHVIYGSNEAGKSTTLRALEALFYGIEPKSLDNFLHPSAKLSIAAKLQLDQGEVHHLVRQKGKKNSLHDVIHDVPLNPDLPAQWLGVNRDMFGHMFALDQQGLHEGGASILASSGDVGQALFSASVGQQRWLDVLAGLESEAEQLFKARGKNQLIHQNCLDYEAEKKRLYAVSLSSAMYKKQTRQYQQAEDQLRQKEGLLEQCERDFQEAERLLRLMPLMQKRSFFLNQRKTFADLPTLHADFFETYKALKVKRDKLNDRQSSLKDQLDHKRLQSQSCIPDQTLLNAQEDIARLQASFESFKDIEQGKNACQDDIEQQEKALQQQVALWMPNSSVAEFIAKQGKAVQRNTHFLVLRKTWERLEHDQAVFDEQQRNQQSLQEPSSQLRAHWKALLEQARDDENLERELGTLHVSQAQLKQNITSQCRQLLQLELSPQDVLCFAMPDKKTVLALDEQYRVLQQEKQRLDGESAKQRLDLSKVEQAIARLETQGAVPTKAAWQEACARRDEHWQQLSGQWQQEQQDHFQQAMQHADALAEQLYHDSERAHRYAQDQTKKTELLQALETTELNSAHWKQSFSNWQKAWQQAWPESIQLASSPSEMMDDLEQWQIIYRQAESFEHGQVQLLDLEKRILILKQELVHEVSELVSTSSLKVMVKKLEYLLSDLDQQQLAYAEQQKQHNRQIIKQKAFKQEKQQWQQQWQAATADFSSRPFEVQDFFDLLAAIGQAAEQGERLQLLKKEQQRALQQTKSVLTSLQRLHGLLSHVPSHPEDQMQKLTQILDEERQKQSLHDSHQAEAVTLQEELAELEKAQEVSAKDWKQCCAQAGVKDDAGFERLELNIAAKKHLEADIAANDQYIKADVRDNDPDALQAKCLAMDASEQEKAMLVLKETVQALKQRLKIDRDIFAQSKLSFESMTGDAEAAVHAQNLISLRTEMMENVERYRRLKLAAMVLRSKIERYRQENQSEMLSQSSVFFKQLTQGSFQHLSTAYDEKDHTTLVGVRDDDSHVSVDGMSTGTRDQLYLALRLGYLKKRTSNHESVPFILDDVLVHFDDQRSHAAMQTLVEFSNSSQVLMFTHHQHIRDMAKTFSEVQVHCL